MRKLAVLVMLALLPALTLSAAVKVEKGLITTQMLTKGDEVINASAFYPPYFDGANAINDIVGDTMFVGYTWYESQHNGTIGRMLEKDSEGYLHFIWMRGLTANAAGPRHIYYNTVSPTGVQGWPYEGVQVETSDRGGYTTMDVNSMNIAFPAFHQMYESGTSLNMHTALAWDFFPRVGAFLVTEPPWVYDPYPGDLEVIWPRIQLDRNGKIHIVSTENPGAAGAPQRHYYMSGIYDAGSFSVTCDTAWVMVDWTMTIAADMTTSEISDKIAVAWTWNREPGFPGGDPNQYDNDIKLLIDYDGLNPNFSLGENVTRFAFPDSSLLPDTLAADMDTLRAYTDLNVFIDMNDVTHLVFTTPGYYALEGMISIAPSLIWHWSEDDPEHFSLVAEAWHANYIPGAWNRNIQRAELAQDTNTGYLYCMYQYYDSSTVSAGGYPSGEIMMTVSMDNGQNWAEPLNVTNTISPDGALPGQCLSELSPSLAKQVDDYCHIMYVLDRDAGFVVQEEGSATLNEVVYHKVPTSLIPTEPLIEQNIPLHVAGYTPEPWSPEWEGSAVGNEGKSFEPKAFGLEQNYPNPFNPKTSITFSLDSVSPVQLAIYNLRGEKVAVVASGEYGTGKHSITFDASSLASGIYLYKLESGERSLTRKMLLLK